MTPIQALEAALASLQALPNQTDTINALRDHLKYLKLHEGSLPLTFVSPEDILTIAQHRQATPALLERLQNLTDCEFQEIISWMSDNQAIMDPYWYVLAEATASVLQIESPWNEYSPDNTPEAA